MHVRISNKHSGILERIRKLYGGGIYTKKTSGVKEWCVSSNKALAFLEIIHPYSVVKSSVVWLGICFQRFQNKLMPTNPHHRITSEVWDARDATRECVMKMNGRNARRLLG
jgi:hypothetical protein